MTNQPPVIQRRDRGLSISVFKNTGNDGKDYFSVCLQRSYRKPDDKDYTQEQINMYPDDLLRLANLARCAYTDTVAEAYKNRKASNHPAQSFETPDDDIPF